MISLSVSTSLNSLLAGVTAAYPLDSAPISTLGALQQQANDLLVTLDGLLTADDTILVPPPFFIAQQFATAITNVASVAEEEVTLVEIIALVGRAALNIATVGEPFKAPALSQDQIALQRLSLSSNTFGANTGTHGTVDGAFDFNDPVQSGLLWPMYGM